MSETNSIKSSEPNTFKKNLKRVTTTFLILLTTFLLAHFLRLFLENVFCHELGHTTKFTFNKVFAYPQDPAYWGKKQVVYIYAVPSIICLILSIFILYVLRKNRNPATLLKFFFMWLSINLSSIFFVYLIIAPLSFGGLNPDSVFYQGYAVVWAYFKFPEAVSLIFAVIAIILAFVWGLIICNDLLYFSFSRRLLEKKNGKLYILRLFLLWPILLSIPFMVAISLPNFTLFLLAYSTIHLLITAGVFFKITSNPNHLNASKKDIANRYSFDLLLLVIVSIFLVKNLLLI